jgi:hypothetical protein
LPDVRNVDLLIARRFGPVDDERLGFEFLSDEVGVHAGADESRGNRPPPDDFCRFHAAIFRKAERTQGAAG